MSNFKYDPAVIKIAIRMMQAVKANLSHVKSDNKPHSIEAAVYSYCPDFSDSDRIKTLHMLHELLDFGPNKWDEIGWLHRNCPEYAAIKTPWDADTYARVQVWRHQIVDYVLQELEELL